MTNDDFANAFRDAFAALTAEVPGSYRTTGPAGSLLALTYSMVPALNPIIVPRAEPDPDEVAALAAEAARLGSTVPWSIRLRGVPSERISGIAAAHGRTNAQRQPFMTLSGAGSAARPSGVRRVTGDEFETFAAVVAGVFGAPPALVSSVYTKEVLDSPQVVAYVAETPAGEPVAAGVAITTGDYAALTNIGTLPALQKQGYARKVVEALLTTEAKHFYLHAEEGTVPFFEKFGFTTVEDWTMLTP